MLAHLKVRAVVLVAVGGAASGIAYAAVGPSTGGGQPAVAQLAAGRIATQAAVTPAQLKQAIINDLKAKTVQAALITSLKAKAIQNLFKTITINTLKSNQAQPALQTATINALAAQQNQVKLDNLLTKQLGTSGLEQQLTKDVGLANYTQGPAKIISGQFTSTSGSSATLLTVPGVLHVTALWWPSDGTAQFSIVNDSGGTLDYGGDFAGFPYEDTVANNTTELGQLANLPGADGTIAPHATFSFQITPRPAPLCDHPGESVPYRADTHIQATSPGSQITSLDLSAYVTDPTCAAGSALLSGQAVVSPASS